MKNLYAILFACTMLFIASGVQANDNILLQGEYRLMGYSLESGSAQKLSSETGQKSASFYTLHILPGAMDTIHNRGEDLNRRVQLLTQESPLKGFALKAAYAPTSKITIHSAVGLTDTDMLATNSYSDRLGWEIDLGVAYKLLNNLTYEIHFGYMDTGDLFRQSKTYTDVEDITILTNKLTMSF